MKRYVALLRGINISGKNKISMPELKEGLTGLGFAEAVTYLNSGNAAFSSTLDDEGALSDKIRLMLREKFGLDLPVLVVPQESIADILDHAPDWWGSGDQERYDNLIFLIPPLSYEEFCREMGGLKEEYERAYRYKNVVFWSFSRRYYQKTNWWSRTASSSIKDKITIRTANTVRKTAGM